MKNKALIVLLIAIFLFSTLNFASARVPCPRCNGTGTITITETCPICGGEYVTDARITLKRTLAGASGSAARPATSISGVFHNDEEFGAYGVATAQVRTPTETYTNTSDRTYFPPNEDITVTVIVEGIAYAQQLSCTITLSEVGSIDCPECGGTGVVNVTVECPDCGGTGFVDALPQDATNSLILGGAAVGVAAAVLISAVVVVRRKRVSEASLRRMLPSEFQSWVLQRFSGRESSQKDANMGIDGYTVEGYPIQIKQLEDVGRNVVDSFASAMGRSKARTGVIVAFSFGNGTYEGVVRARLHYGFAIKTVTVKELIESPSRTY